MRFFLTAALALCIASLPAYSQQTATASNVTTVPEDQSDREARVVIATSGGISLGSYQAGVNWGLVELLRRAQMDDTLRSQIARSGMATPRIVGLSGASAGTINSIMSAMHYCRDGGRVLPEESLFWRTWVDVGWRELMPYGSKVQPPEYGLIDRAYFSDVLLERLRSDLSLPGRPGCSVQVAASLTKQLSAKEEVFDRVSIAVQRHVGTYAIAVDSASQKMKLQQASPLLRRDGSVGFQISLASPRPDNELSVDQVFELAKASSSIPFVFAPILLDYYRSDALDQTGVCPMARPNAVGCAKPFSARFVDGGAFDNRPIGVADRLLATSRDAEPPTRPTLLHTIFIVPSARRTEVLAAPDTASERVGGSSLVTQVLGNMWGAASAYELHAYSRNRSIDTGHVVAVADTVEVTSRALPIFGETLKNFGAFLARPFREHDFYVGVYDALHFAADRLCGRVTALPDQSHATVLAECHVNTLASLTHRVDVGCTGRLMVSRFYFREHAVTPELGDGDEECLRFGVSDSRVRMLLLTADLYEKSYLTDTKCVKSYSAIENVVCESGLLKFAHLAVSEGLTREMREYVRVHPECSVSYTSVDSISAACFADDFVIRLLETPNDFLKRLTFSGLERAAAVERVGQRMEQAGFSDARLGVANAILRNIIGRPTRSSWEWDRSSVPRECPDGNLYPKLGWCGVVQSAFRGLVPYYATGGIGAISFETGVRPSYHADAEVSLVMPLSVHYGRVNNLTPVKDGAPARQPWGSAGLGIEWRNHSIMVNSCFVSMSWRTSFSKETQVMPNERHLYRMSCDLMASRFTVGVTTTRFTGRNRETWALTFGLADLNGLLYWLVPQELRTRF